MLVLISEFLLECRVESTDDKVAVVFILHQLLDTALFQEADPATFQHRRRHILQKLLILAVSAQRIQFNIKSYNAPYVTQNVTRRCGVTRD